MPKTIAIIGGGLSGTLVLLNLLKSAKSALEVTWFDKDNAFARGLAYSTPHDYHLLNVRAAGMSLYSDDKDHFVNWLSDRGLRYGSQDFVPRKIFGDYAQEELDRLTKSRPDIRIRAIAEAVKDMSRQGKGYIVSAGRDHYADEVVLALGNFPPAHPRHASATATGSPNYFQNPFDPKCLPAALQEDAVLVIGSGLTMIDTILGLHHRQYKGTITVISTHGYLPQTHSPGGLPAIPPFLGEEGSPSLQGLLALVNKALKKAKKEGFQPHSVVDQLRPQVQAYWQQFSLAEKKQFLRHLRHKWGVARHRAPAESISILSGMVEQGRLRVVKGRTSSISEDPGGFMLSYRGPDGTPGVLKAGSIINCTGPESDYGALQDELVRNLLAKGYIAADGLRYGLQAHADGTLAPGLYTLGPPLKGILWESTAVPEIRVQARDLALKILDN